MNLNNLNENQLKAVTTTEGPLLVMAGAGSGKTKVLTTRIAYLISECNVNPEEVLAITFTNKAAKEMKDRVINMLGHLAYKIQISTFHSFGLSIMKKHYDKLGYQKNFTIIDSDDVLTLIKKILKEYNYDPKIYNPKGIRNQISGAKNELLDAKSYAKYANSEYEQVVLKVYKRYEEKLKTNNSLDFDDLLMQPIVLFKKYPQVLKEYQERFKYILIDEYQDTNEAQYILTKLVSAKYKNICVVGDSDQSIYSFRGSNYKNILNFEKDYQNAKVILLEKNYRSTKNILNVANDIIKNNKLRKEKNLWTDNEEGLKVTYHRSENEKDEAFYVTREINKLKQTEPLKEIAVLYRTNAQSRNIEEYLLKENIPYKVVGSIYFYKRKEIKDLIAYLNVLYNPSDDISLLRVINVPKRGIGSKTIEALTDKANLENKSIYEVITSGKELEFKKIIENINSMRENLSLTELIDLVLSRTGMKDELVSEKTLEAEIRLENLNEFKSITRSFEESSGNISLDDFLMEISLVSDIEEYKNNDNVVTLMTVHAAKGLEFNNIFIIGLEESVFPHVNSFDAADDIEEERRLCYVAVTRARKKLWLVNAKRRTLYGKDSMNPPSRFIKEISDVYLDSSEEKGVHVINKADMIDKDAEYNVGDKVAFPSFGEGIIVSMDARILTVAFPHPIGIKKLIKGHKNIRKV